MGPQLNPSHSVSPFTLIYLIDNEKVLLLKRNVDKKLLPGKWLGLGGKVEPGEELVASAVREFKEETGLTLKNLILQGTFSWLSENERWGTSYIFMATQYEGTLEKSDEGELQWHKIQELEHLAGFAEHQKFFLPKLLSGEISFYTGIAVYEQGKLVKYADTIESFKEREQKRNKEIG